MNIRFNHSIRYYFILAGLTLLSLLAIQILAFVFIKTGTLPDDPLRMNGFHLFFMVVIQAGSFLSIFYFTSRWLPKSIFLRLSFPKWNEIIHVFFGYFLLLIFLGLIQNILQNMGFEMEQFHMLDKKKIFEKPVYFFLAVTFIAPFYEEIIFRGFFLGSLWPIKGKWILFRKTFAVLFSSFVFTLMHFESLENSIILLPIFFLSVFLSYIAIRFQNIVLPILIHFFQNGISSIVFYFLSVFLHLPS